MNPPPITFVPGEAPVLNWADDEAAAQRLIETNVFPGATAVKVRRCGILKAIVTHEPTKGWMISVSHPYRLPSYFEIKSARYALIPDYPTMAMIFPLPENWVNIHPNCLQLVEVPAEYALR